MPTLEVTVIQGEREKHVTTPCKGLVDAKNLVTYFAERWVIVGDPYFVDGKRKIKLALPGGD